MLHFAKGKQRSNAREDLKGTRAVISKDDTLIKGGARRRKKTRDIVFWPTIPKSDHRKAGRRVSGREGGGPYRSHSSSVISESNVNGGADKERLFHWMALAT